MHGDCTDSIDIFYAFQFIDYFCKYTLYSFAGKNIQSSNSRVTTKKSPAQEYDNATVVVINWIKDFSFVKRTTLLF